MNGAIDLVRGMRDVPPADLDIQAAVAAKLETTLASYGYQAIELPILERRDLYLRKLGEELVGKVYEFSFNGRELALRPEWTASVLRAYVARMQDQPLPLRLSYAGPVFRNERPQRVTYRQFTQIGIELIGAPSPRADAECLALACSGLDAAGLQEYRIRLGHIGLIRTVLNELGLAERTQEILVWSLERMRTRGQESIRNRLLNEDEEQLLDPALLEGLDDAQAEALLRRALELIGVNLQFGTRPPEAIVNRLVRKLRREDPRSQVERALAILGQLSELSGDIESTLPRVAAILQEFGLSTTALNEIRAILELVAAHGIPTERITLDIGLGRGLHYYTGMIFEIFDQNDMQLCGGGRYDDLVTSLGGRQTVPAVGFAYGLERVVAALPQATGNPSPAEVLVVAAEAAAYPYALRVAQTLRQRGWIAAVDLRERSVATNIRDASRRGISTVAVVNSSDEAQSQVLWRNLTTREEQRIELDQLPGLPSVHA